jgi:predicted nucleotidyltransferase
MYSPSKTIFRSYRGSIAQGLETSSSDYDYFEIFIPSERQILGITSDQKESGHKIDGKSDTHRISLKRFVQGLVVGRVTDIEPLFCKDEHVLINKCPYLRDNRLYMLSQRLIKPLLGMVNHQKDLALKGNRDRYREDIGYDPKAACHCTRALYQAFWLKRLGVLRMHIDDQAGADRLMKIKRGELDLEEIETIWHNYEDVINRTAWHHLVPQSINVNKWEEFLINTYKEHLS